MDSWQRYGLMVLPTPRVVTQTHGMISVLLNHTHTSEPHGALQLRRFSGFQIVPAWSLKTRRCSKLGAWIAPAFCSGLSPHKALKLRRRSKLDAWIAPPSVPYCPSVEPKKRGSVPNWMCGSQGMEEPGEKTLQRGRIYGLVLLMRRATDHEGRPAWQRQAEAEAGKKFLGLFRLIEQDQELVKKNMQQLFQIILNTIIYIFFYLSLFRFYTKTVQVSK